MIKVPAFKSGLRVVSVAGGALLLSEDGGWLLRGKAYEKIVPLIDGVRGSVVVVAAAEDNGLDSSVAWYTLLRMEAAGHLTESRPEIDPDVAAFWDGLGLDAAEALAALRSARARVSSVGLVASDRFSDALGQFGITVSLSADDVADGSFHSDLDIVLTDDYLADALLPFDAEARAAQRRWLLVRPAGFEIWIGPLFEPGKTGCLHCLRHKLARHRRLHRSAARFDPRRGTAVPLAAVSATTEVACQLAAVEVAKALAGVEPDLTGTVLSFDLRERSANLHKLIKRPNCPVCGDAFVNEAVPLRLQQSQTVMFNGDGGYRTVTPDETFKTYSHLVSPITGVAVALTASLSGKGVGDVYYADAALDIAVPPPGSPGRLTGVRRGGSGGKGMTAVQASVSALSEAIERYSAEVQDTDLKIPGSFREMGADAIHPNDVMGYSDRQYRERGSWNATKARRHYVPEPFDPDARINWTPLWSLTRQRHKLLPTELLFLHFGRNPVDGKDKDTKAHVFSCSNGCASGNTLEEAVLQGFLELIERDAVAIWWYNRLRCPAIDLTSFGDAWLSNLAACYDAWGRDIVAIDLTHDLGIPVVAGVSHVRKGGATERIIFGFGCHLDIRIATQRAMTEMSQLLVIDISHEAGHFKTDEEGEVHEWFSSSVLANHPHLVPDATVSPRTRESFPSWRIDDISGCIDICRQAVEKRGMEVLVLDQTRSDTGMPAVKVVVPGLRHFWARFGPGRLYDVPVEMGLIETPVSEADLNPTLIFF